MTSRIRKGMVALLTVALIASTFSFAFEASAAMLNSTTIKGEDNIVPLIGGADDSHWQIQNPTCYNSGSGYTAINQQQETFGTTYVNLFEENGDIRVGFMDTAIGNYGSTNTFGNIVFLYNCPDKNQYIDFNKDSIRIDVNCTLAQQKSVQYPFLVRLNFDGISTALPVSLFTSNNSGYITGRFVTDIKLSDFLNYSWASAWASTISAHSGKLKLNTIEFVSSLEYYGTSGASFYINDFYLVENTAPVLVPLSTNDDAGSMWETEYQPNIFVPITETKYPLFVNASIDDSGVLTATKSGIRDGVAKLRVPMEQFQAREIDLSKDMNFYYDFTAYNCTWTLELTFSEKGYNLQTYYVSLAKKISTNAGITGKALTDSGDSGTYQGYINLTDVINEYGLTSMVNTGETLDDKTIVFSSFQITFTPTSTTHVTQFRHLSFGHGAKTFATAPVASTIGVPESIYEMPDMDSTSLCPSATSSGWQVCTVSNPTGYSDLSTAVNPLATVSNTTDGKVIIQPTAASRQPSGYFIYPTMVAQYVFAQPFGLNMGTDFISMDLSTSDNYIITLYIEADGVIYPFRISTLICKQNDWCSIKQVDQDYQLSLFQLIYRDFCDAFGIYNETLSVIKIEFQMSVEWTNSQGVNMTFSNLALLTPKDNTTLVTSGIDALTVNGRVLTSDDRAEVLQLKEKFNGLTTGQKATISQTRRNVLKKAVSTVTEEDYNEVSLIGSASSSGWQVKKPVSGTGSDYASDYIENSMQTSVIGTNYITFTDIGNGAIEALYQTAAVGKYGTGNYGSINFQYNHGYNPIAVDFTQDKIRLNIESCITSAVGYPFYIELYFDGYSEPMKIQLLTSSSTSDITVINGQYFIEIDLKAFLDGNWFTGGVDWRSRILQHNGILKLSKEVFRQNITWYGDAGIHMKIYDFSILQPDSDAPVLANTYKTSSTSNTILVSWDAAEDNATSAKDISYDFYYSNEEISEDNILGQSPFKTVIGDTGLYAFVLNLNTDTKYWFAIKTTDKKGNSKYYYCNNPIKTKAAKLGNQLSMLGAQALSLQGNIARSLRFGAQITYNEINGQNIIYYNDSPYTVVEYGMILVPTDQLAADEELTINTVNIKAKIVPSSRIYDSGKYKNGKSYAIYTVVVNNIAEANFTRDISACAYVKCLDSEQNVCYFYSDIISRNAVALHQSFI